MKRWLGVMIVIALVVSGLSVNPIPSFAAIKPVIDVSCYRLTQRGSCQNGVGHYSMNETIWDISPLTLPTNKATKTTSTIGDYQYSQDNPLLRTVRQRELPVRL